jgi:DNA repair protein RadA/Sms
MKNYAYYCQECEFKIVKWQGKCNQCGQWNSFVEISKSSKNIQNIKKPIRLNEVKIASFIKLKTGISEFDSVLGNGITMGSIILLGGEPGVGKSTLIMQVLSKLSTQNQNILYISGEENESQVAQRANRLNTKFENFLIYFESTWEKIKKEIIKTNSNIIVIDSIQTLVANEHDNNAGSINQVKGLTQDIVEFGKNLGLTIFIVGHITKSGSIAGPKHLEHMVDTVLLFEINHENNFRTLKSTKNRFGSTGEIGVFEFAESGLVKAKINNEINVKNKRSVYSSYIEGKKNLKVEIQSLVIENKFNTGKRIVTGIDASRLQILLAILENTLEVPISYSDVYLDVIGGLKIRGRESDLSIIVSLYLTFKKIKLNSIYAFLGEVNLNGDVLPVKNINEHVRFLKKLGVQKYVISSAIENYSTKYCIKKISNINELPDLIAS